MFDINIMFVKLFYIEQERISDVNETDHEIF